MKKLILFSAFIATFLFGCKTQEKTAGYTYDDVYSTKSDQAKISSKPKMQNEDLSGSHTIASPDSSSALTSTSDASTSSSGGYSPDVSMYFGNSWGSSFWGPSYSFGFGYGFGDYGYGYPYYGYGYPYYWGYPYYYYPYYYGYGYGYYDYPYWGNNGCNWNNGYYRGSYYGQRRTLSTPDGGRNSRTNAGGTNPVPGQVKNTRTTDPVITNRSSDQTRSGRTDINRVPPDKQRYKYTRSGTQENTRVVRNDQNNKTRSDRNYVQRQEPSPRYTRPGNKQQATRSDAQTYSSPAYRQPKSSQEYINPRTQQGRPTGVKENSNRNGNNSTPAPSGKRYSSPSNTGGNSRIYSNPSGGGSRSYSTPSRSSSSPGNSAPSRSSSPSYSAPSHSSSTPSNSGGNSGSSGGGGRRR